MSEPAAIDISSTLDSPTAVSGRVVRTQSGFFTVELNDGRLIICQVSGRLKIDAQRAVSKEENQRRDLVALNDLVTVEITAPNQGMIIEVAERQHVLSRVSPGAAAGTSAESEQIILANTDQVVFVLAARKPNPNPRALDRMLVIAEKAEIPSIVICVNKIDLVEQVQMDDIFGLYQHIGYRVLYTSALRGDGIDELRTILTHDDHLVSVFSGPSGVGKSSLLNALQAGLSLETNDVSTSTTKGRHTTRFSQLIKFNDGGYVADTPGIRSVVPWDIEPHELDSYFIEMRPFIQQCKFADCSHRHEPGCAVLAAVEEGQVTAGRHDSYLRLRDELEEQFIY